MQRERKGWYLGGGCGEYRGVLVVESKIWQLIDLSGKDKNQKSLPWLQISVPGEMMEKPKPISVFIKAKNYTSAVLVRNQLSLSGSEMY